MRISRSEESIDFSETTESLHLLIRNQEVFVSGSGPAFVSSARCRFSTPTLLIGVAIYAAGFLTYHSSATYTFADPMFTTGLFIIVAHFGSTLSPIRSLASAVARVGFYSYGLYLIHEPLVCFFGLHLHDTNLLTFTFIAWLIIPILAVISMELERTVNALAERVLGHSSHEAAKPLEPGQKVS